MHLHVVLHFSLTAKCCFIKAYIWFDPESKTGSSRSVTWVTKYSTSKGGCAELDPVAAATDCRGISLKILLIDSYLYLVLLAKCKIVMVLVLQSLQRLCSLHGTIVKETKEGTNPCGAALEDQSSRQVILWVAIRITHLVHNQYENEPKHLAELPEEGG